MSAGEKVHPCEYCGTMLDEDETEESNIAAAGPRIGHFAATCRERVFAASRAKSREIATLTVSLAEARERLAERDQELSEIRESRAAGAEAILLMRERLAKVRAETISECVTYIEDDAISNRMAFKDITHDRIALAARMLIAMRKRAAALAAKGAT